MKEYIMSVIGAGILCSFSEIISPEKWKKYVKLMTGVIITIIMISPVKQIDFRMIDDLNDKLAVDIADNMILKNTVKYEFEKKIAIDIQERIKKKYDVESEVFAEAKTDADGNVIGISAVKIKTVAESSGVTAMIAEIYGVNKELVMVNAR